MRIDVTPKADDLHSGARFGQNYAITGDGTGFFFFFFDSYIFPTFWLKITVHQNFAYVSENLRSSVIEFYALKNMKREVELSAQLFELKILIALLKVQRSGKPLLA